MSEIQTGAEKAREKDSQNQELNYPQGAKDPKLIKRQSYDCPVNYPATETAAGQFTLAQYLITF